jgi:hypothetical protein
MPIIELPIHKGIYKDVDTIANRSDYAESMINCYVDEMGNVNKSFGLKLFSDLKCEPFMGMYYSPNKDYLYVVNKSGHVFKVDRSGHYTDLSVNGEVLYDYGYPAIFAENQNTILIANGGRVIYTDGKLPVQYIPDENAPTSVSHVAFLGGFFAVNQIGTQNWQPSDFQDITFLNYQINQKIQHPDLLIALKAFQNYIYCFGTTSIEIWGINQSNSSSIFGLYLNYSLDRGCSAPYSIVQANESLYFLDDTRRFLQLQGASFNLVSMPVDLDIQSFGTVNDCIGDLIEINGRHFIKWAFPAEGKTFIYDFSINQWFEQNSWDDTNGIFIPYISNYHCYAFGKHILGSRLDGKLYIADIRYYNEGGNVLKTSLITANSDYGNPDMKICEWLDVWAKRGYGEANPNNETLLGVIDGINTTFTLSQIPVIGSEHIYRNGQRLNPNIDYTILNDTITMNIAPLTANQKGDIYDDILTADYRTNNNTNLMIRFKDELQDWSNYINVDLGLLGGTNAKYRIYSLGSFRMRQWEFTTAGTIPFILTKAQMMVSTSF